MKNEIKYITKVANTCCQSMKALIITASKRLNPHENEGGYPAERSPCLEGESRSWATKQGDIHITLTTTDVQQQAGDVFHFSFGICQGY